MGKSRNLVTERFILLTLQICERLFARGKLYILLKFLLVTLLAAEKSSPAYVFTSQNPPPHDSKVVDLDSCINYLCIFCVHYIRSIYSSPLSLIIN